MDKVLIEDRLYKIIGQFSEKKINQKKIYSKLLDNIHPFYDRNERTCKILFCLQFVL